MSKKVKTMSIIPAPTEAAIQPKPTRTEIIEALTRLKVETMEAENKVKKEAIEAQKTVIQNLALQELSAHLATGRDLRRPLSPFIAEKGEVRVHRGGYGSNYVEFSVRVADKTKDAESHSKVGVKASKELIAEFAKLEKLPSPNNWIREDEIRKEIRASLSRDSAGRVSRLLSDVESRAALSDLLKVVEAGAEKRLN
jgi:hypothetical protein